MQLKNIEEPIKFKIKIDTADQTVMLFYTDFEETESFADFYGFLESYSTYYRNRIDIVDNHEEKLSLCNYCIDTLVSYEYDLRSFFINRDLFKTEVKLKIDLFTYWKNRILEQKLLKPSKQENNRKPISLRNRILILEYLGIIDFIKKLDAEEGDKYRILSDVLDSDFDNTSKWSRNLYEVAEKGSTTKTSRSLEEIREYFTDLNLIDQVEKVKKDIAKINFG